MWVVTLHRECTDLRILSEVSFDLPSFRSDHLPSKELSSILRGTKAWKVILLAYLDENTTHYKAIQNYTLGLVRKKF